MVRCCAVLLTLLFIATDLKAQHSMHVIRFRDKNGTPYQFNQARNFLSPASISRRNRHQIQLDSTDLPISPRYIDSVLSIPGVAVKNKSKWLNQVLVKITDQEALSKIASFPFVISMKPVAPRRNPGFDEIISGRSRKNDRIPISEPVSTMPVITGPDDNAIEYGTSFNQVHMHEGEFLHNLGYRGQTITIAVLDGGYTGYDINPALDSLKLQKRLLGGYDFVTDQPTVSQHHFHGHNCLTIMAANRPGVIVGTAPSAKYWLLRSEDVSSEYPIEEHYWAAAAEFADSVGADMISSSLGYTSFNDPELNHPYSDRDGNTCMSTIAADLAAKKGMIVMNSAGNYGGLPSDEKYIVCPADGDSVVSVGAVKRDSTIAPFSSWGPAYSGKVKPNLVSTGQGTYYASSSGQAAFGNGTSYSNPNLAGLFACLWEAFPEFKNMEIIDAVQRSADRYANPDNRYGYGIPNFRVAYEILKEERLRRNIDNILTHDFIKAYQMGRDIQVVLRSPVTGTAFLRLIDIQGRQLANKSLTLTQGQVQQAKFDNLPGLSTGIYFLQYSDGENKKVVKVLVKN